jgi:Fe2+ or Zn2+ uptake regulation protein
MIFNKMDKKKSIKVSQTWQHEFSRSGGRITRPRQVILDVIAGSQRPLTPQEVHDEAREQLPQIGLVTVYRTIEKLEGLGLVNRVHHSDQCQTVFRSTPSHQHLLICTECGQSVYFDGLEIEKEFQKTGENLGYTVTGHWLQLSGMCSDCQKGNLQ